VRPLADQQSLVQPPVVETSGDNSIRARVTEYRPDRLRLMQTFLSIGVITTTIARHSFGPIMAGTATIALVATVVTLWRATRSTTGQKITVKEGAIRLGDRHPKITRADVRRWTYSRNTASLHCGETNYRVSTGAVDGPALERSLTEFLGAPEPLEYRGSLEARLIALCVALTGLVLLIVAFATNRSLVLIFIGIPSFILGFATFATFSQRVIRAR
jgi:hypothetical protein